MPKSLVAVVLAHATSTRPETALGRVCAPVLTFVALIYLFCAEVALVARAAGEEESNVWPQTVGCTQPTKPVEDSNLRHDLGLYSVLPPRGASWCVETRGARIEFFKNDFMGRVLDRPRHSFMAMAYASRGPRSLLDTPQPEYVQFLKSMRFH